MIYLRKFNESISSAISDDLRMGNYIDQLKDFCESNLVYLLDEGFQLKYDTQVMHFPEIRTIKHDGDAGVNVKIMCPNHRKSNLPLQLNAIHWSEIRDYIIPFLQRLCNEYQLYTYYEEREYDHEKSLIVKEDKYVALQEEKQFKYYTLEDLIEDKLPQDKWFYSLSVKVQIEK